MRQARSDAHASQLEDLLKRPREYYNIDGVGEISSGIICCGYTLLAYLQMHTTREAVWHQMPTFILYLTVLIAIVHHGSEAIKNRLTYPRTGFVNYGSRFRQWPRMVAIGAIAALLSAALAYPGWNVTVPHAIPGLAFAFVFAVRFARTVRWKWAVACAMAASAIVIGYLAGEMLASVAHQSSLPPLEPAMLGAFWLTMLIDGCLLMVSGALSLWLYMRVTKAPESASQ